MEGIVHNSKFVDVVAGSLGNNFFTLLDVGCSGGIDPVWRRFGSNLRAFGFDPSLAEVNRLNQGEITKQVEYVAGFVGVSPDTPGFERMASQDYWGRSPWSRLAVCKTLDLRSKKVDPNDDREKMRLNLWQETKLADPKKPILIPQFLDEKQIDDVDFIKIDVDGPDFLILRSILAELEKRNVLGVGIEVNFHGTEHPDVNSFHNVDRTMRAAGFDLFDLSVRRYSSSALPAPYLYGFPAQSKIGRPIQGDALYLRDLASSDRTHRETLLTPQKIAKLAALFALFGQPDSAAELLTQFSSKLDQLIDISKGMQTLLDQMPDKPAIRSYKEYLTAFEQDDARFYRSSEKS